MTVRGALRFGWLARDQRPPRAQSSRWAIFAVVAAALFMSSLDGTIVATALPALQRELDASIAWAGWTITAYSLGLVLMVPVAGVLSERYGERVVFLVSVAVFTIASFCCGLATNIYVLVGLRFLEALGGAGFTPSATGIIVEHFGSSRDKAVGLFGSIFSVGAIVGPIFGGLFVTYWSWRGIFLVNVPIGIALFVLCLRVVPRDAAPLPGGGRGRFDYVGMAQLGIGVLGVMLAFNALSAGLGAIASAGFLLPAAAAGIALWCFALHTRKTRNPFIAARFLAGHGFGAVNIVNVMGGMVVGLVALLPLYASIRYGISALDAGTLLSVEGAAFIAVSGFAAMSLRRTGYRLPIYFGITLMVLGIAALSAAPHGMSPYLWLAAVAGFIGIGAGCSSPASRNAGLQLAPEAAPTLAGLRTISFQIGSIVTISITTALISATSAPGAAHGYVYIVWAVLIALLTPVIARVPEHRGAW
ncbi:MAG TPA: MFS transporter [Nevskiaceae bacterium]